MRIIATLVKDNRVPKAIQVERVLCVSTRKW